MKIHILIPTLFLAILIGCNSNLDYEGNIQNSEGTLANQFGENESELNGNNDEITASQIEAAVEALLTGTTTTDSTVAGKWSVLAGTMQLTFDQADNLYEEGEVVGIHLWSAPIASSYCVQYVAHTADLANPSQLPATTQELDKYVTGWHTLDPNGYTTVLTNAATNHATVFYACFADCNSTIYVSNVQPIRIL